MALKKILKLFLKQQQQISEPKEFIHEFSSKILFKDILPKKKKKERNTETSSMLFISKFYLKKHCMDTQVYINHNTLIYYF